MLSKKQRVPRKIFPILLKEAKVFRNELFVLRVFPSKGLKNRFGFSVSKKISSKAVVRNKLRRAGYNILRNFLSEIQFNGAAVFYFLKLPKNDDEISRNIKLILKKAKLIQ